ncbi:hypothetical protein A1OO_21760 [Enterovibrio norvegicus FF-33]|uniref:hypothetical protein n=1 Tax=Enterovibrio norvegicus TaxID=188144 RepID=UPI00036C5F44|nr:hypothetical protein [Enterovibrio norvegicus]OEE64819.1 hypothetical protein A1OO_21760 [Enterovibrio norvegicus FF-33]OEE86853.1 hypothetical protein A1OQ_16380 [Enterovibrio norvegicus FF-162]
MKTNFFSKFGLSKKSSVDIEHTNPLPLNFNKNTYPQVKLSQEHKSQAYYLFFLLSKPELGRFMSALSSQSGDSTPEQGLILNLSLYEDFTGYVVSFTCNNEDTVKKITQLKLAPPLPHQSFPRVDPNSYGSLQGNLDLWFTHFWAVYWNSMTTEEKQAISLPPDWSEFMESRF